MRPPGRGGGQHTRVPLIVGGTVFCLAVVLVVTILMVTRGRSPGSATPAARPTASATGDQAAGTTDVPAARQPDTGSAASTGDSAGRLSSQSANPAPSAGQVQLAGGNPAPAAGTVQALLQRYFDAVNAHDFQAWAGTVTPGRLAAVTPNGWTRSYRSTQDSSILVSAISSTGPDTVTAAVSFTSVQDTADAPPDLPVGRICWQTTFVIVNVSAGGQVGVPPRNSAVKNAC